MLSIHSYEQLSTALKAIGEGSQGVGPYLHDLTVLLIAEISEEAQCHEKTKACFGCLIRAVPC